MPSPIDLVFNTAVELLECARVGLEDYGLQAPCRVCVVPGEIVFDTCANGGQLVISTSEIYYANVFPIRITQDTSVPTPCGPGIVVADFTLSLMRCAPGPGKGNPPPPPTCEALQASALEINRDSFVLRSAVMCCLSELKNDRTLIDYRLGGSLVTGPEGGCVGNTVQILVGFTNG